MWYTEIKNGIEAWAGLDRDALHIHFAILAYLLVWAVIRRPSVLPWLVVLLLELANEALDLTEQYRTEGRTDWTAALDLGLAEAAKDVVNTMIWPTAMLLFTAGRELLKRRSASQAADPEPPVEPVEEEA